jgi:uncharacterized protein YcbK (DUF882 family)
MDDSSDKSGSGGMQPAHAPRRRRVLAAAAIAGLAGAVALAIEPLPRLRPGSVARHPKHFPLLVARRAAPRELWVTRPEAQEQVRAVYWADGALQPEGYRALEHIFRDITEGVRHPIAIDLLDLNFAMQGALHSILPPQPIVLFSGFRTARSSARVGGANPDIHGLGLADDFILPGLGFEDNLRLARLFQVGGLGVYPARGSLHKDVGPLRSWVDATPAPQGRGAP